MAGKKVTMDHVTTKDKQAFIEAANALRGSHRRQFMARIVNGLGWGAAAWANRELGWNRCTIIKGQRELEAGRSPFDPSGGKGRPKAEHRLPNLLDDIKAIVDGQNQTGRMSTSKRLSTRAVRQALIDRCGYTHEELPTQETIRVKLNDLGYSLRILPKSHPTQDTQQRMAG